MRRLPSGLRRPRGLRGRLTLVSTAVALVGLALGGWLLSGLLEERLENNLDATLTTETRTRVQLLDGGADPVSLGAPRGGESIVWIGTEPTVAGTLAAGGSYTIAPPFELPPIDDAETVELTLLESSDEGVEQETTDVRVATAVAADGTIVITGSEQEEITAPVRALQRILLVGVPLVGALIGLLSWVLLGRALEPVERIRSQAETIGGSNLATRVPVPESDDELRALAQTLNGMLDRIEGHDAAVRRFTSDASHELKSPVANIRALVETTRLDDPAWPTVQTRLGDEADRLSMLVSNLLFLSTADEHGVQLRVERTHLDDLVFSEADALRQRGVQVDIGGVSPETIDADTELVRRALRNLADNAARHAQSAVGFGIERVADDVIVTIDDDGPGIPDDQREVVFERFTRLDHGRDRGAGGTGLGLAIASDIARAHGGTLVAGDSPLGGARFSLRLPASNVTPVS